MASNKRAPVISTTVIALLVVLGGAFASAGWSEESVRIVVRWTARIAVVLFVMAFSASSLRVFWRSGATSWLLVHRRRLGLAFATAHGVHLAALVALGVWFPDPFLAETTWVTYVVGGLVYAFIFAMAATSNDASVRALGRRRWQLLHTFGSWAVWVIFAQSFGGRVATEPTWSSATATTLLLGAFGLRMARRVRARSRATVQPSASGSVAS